MGPDEMRRALAARSGRRRSREALVARMEPFRAVMYSLVPGGLTARTEDQREGHPAGLGAGALRSPCGPTEERSRRGSRPRTSSIPTSSSARHRASFHAVCVYSLGHVVLAATL